MYYFTQTTLFLLITWQAIEVETFIFTRLWVIDSWFKIIHFVVLLSKYSGFETDINKQTCVTTVFKAFDFHDGSFQEILFLMTMVNDYFYFKEVIEPLFQLKIKLKVIIWPLTSTKSTFI